MGTTFGKVCEDNGQVVRTIQTHFQMNIKTALKGRFFFFFLNETNKRSNVHDVIHVFAHWMALMFHSLTYTDGHEVINPFSLTFEDYTVYSVELY